MARNIERVGAIALINNPQNSKRPDLVGTNLYGHHIYKDVIQQIDEVVGNGERGCLAYERHIAAPSDSFAKHHAFNYELLKRLRPGYMGPEGQIYKKYYAGHSIGEMMSLVQAGCLELPTAVQCAMIRESVTNQHKGLGSKFMFALTGITVAKALRRIPRIDLSHIVGGTVSAEIANRNTPSQLVISVHAEEAKGDDDHKNRIADEFAEKLLPYKDPDSKVVRGIVLPITSAFHAKFNANVEAELIEALSDVLDTARVREPDPRILYSPMLGRWVSNREQIFQIVNHQLTMGVHFTKAVYEISRIRNLVAIVTADGTGVTANMTNANLSVVKKENPDMRDIPVLNIKDLKSLHETADTAAQLLVDFSKT